MDSAPIDITLKYLGLHAVKGQKDVVWNTSFYGLPYIL